MFCSHFTSVFPYQYQVSIHQFSVFVDLSILTLSLGTDNTTERTTKSSPHTNSIINKTTKNQNRDFNQQEFGARELKLNLLSVQ